MAATTPAVATDLVVRWESPTRYYLARIQLNLFGELELLRVWGGRGSRMGGSMTEPLRDLEDAARSLAKENAHRLTRGYRPVVSCRPTSATRGEP